MSRDRTAYQNPLFQAVTQMAYGGLPTYARQGTQLSGTLSNQAPPAAPQSGGGMNPLLAGGLGALGGAALQKLGPQGDMLGALIDGIKKLLAHRGQSIQGNKPYGGGALMGPGADRSFAGWDPSVSDPFGNPYLTSDPGSWYGPDGGAGMVNDPSGGSGVGPGMQDYYASQSGGGEPTMPEEWWGDE